LLIILALAGSIGEAAE